MVCSLVLALVVAAQHIRRIIQKVESLGEDQFPSGSRKLHTAEHEYRVRVRDYRVIYQVDVKARVVTIFNVRHRRFQERNRAIA
jgi:mRNA interferase RelE/StbE